MFHTATFLGPEAGNWNNHIPLVYFDIIDSQLCEEVKSETKRMIFVNKSQSTQA